MPSPLPHYRPSAPILIAGLGKSGLAAAALAARDRIPAVLWDTRPPDALPPDTSTALASLPYPHHLGTPLPPPLDYSLAVVSPGLDVASPPLAALSAASVPLLSECEFGWIRHRGLTYAVTGSNGKSSLVKLLADAFAAAGRTAVPCGNYGLPVSTAVLAAPEILLVEVSSFQLETFSVFRPHAAILLNLLPNHLDRHKTLNAYAALKARLFSLLPPDRPSILPADLPPPLRAHFPATAATLFGGPDAPPAAWRWTPGAILPPDTASPLSPPALKNPHSSPLTPHSSLLTPRPIPFESPYFDNPVLGPAAAAAAALAHHAGLPLDVLARAARDFQPLPHRCTPVATVRGVRCIDDSKATNLAALIAALRMLPPGARVHLIAGGRPKETDFTPALPHLHRSVASVHLIGEAASAMHAAWSDAVPCQIDETLDRAVPAALSLATPGDILLFAPACTSFDQYPSYAARGAAFAALCRSLPA